MRFAITAAVVLGLAGTASAATFVVPSQGIPNIQTAVNGASTGDTILIKKGWYRENVIVNASGLKFVGRGVTWDGNVLGADGDALTITGDDTVIQGITFRNGNYQINVIAGNRTQVMKCSFLDPAQDGVYVDLGNDTVVTGCRFVGVGSDGAEIYGNGTILTKNLVQQSGNRGFYLEGDAVRVEGNSFFNLDDSNGVYVLGNNAVVVKNKASLVDSDVVRIDGNGALVELNKADRCDSRLANVAGINATVQKNSASYVQGAVFVDGDGAQVLSNKISNCGSSDAISVVGDAVTIRGNSIATTWDDADGISVSINTAGGGTIEGNRMTDCAGNGLNLQSDNLVVRSNTCTRCGQDNRAGISVVGDINNLEANTSTDADNIGILVNGNTNTVVRCAVKNALADGIKVSAGNNNTFDTCSATGCGGEGFDNRGTNTALTGGSYLKNRFDVANDLIGGASFTDTTLAGVRFVSGGNAQQPEVD